MNTKSGLALAQTRLLQKLEPSLGHQVSLACPRLPASQPGSFHPGLWCSASPHQTPAEPWPHGLSSATAAASGEWPLVPGTPESQQSCPVWFSTCPHTGITWELSEAPATKPLLRPIHLESEESFYSFPETPMSSRGRKVEGSTSFGTREKRHKAALGRGGRC